MNLTKEQVGLLKRLVRSDEWDALMKARDEYIGDELSAVSVTGGNAFETLRELHLRQGAIEHLVSFFEKIERKDA